MFRKWRRRRWLRRHPLTAHQIMEQWLNQACQSQERWREAVSKISLQNWQDAASRPLKK
jgi:hypothetical protein